MNLNRSAREYYSLAITTTPAIASWEASFDGGTTWLAGTPGTVDGVAVQRWLLAGPNATQGTAVAVISASVVPLIRATDSPEIVARHAPAITLT